MIPVVYRANFNYLLRHPWQLALAILGIGIGVAVIVAVDLANASARKAFLMSMDAVTGEATHQVVGGPRGLDEDFYVELRVAHGMRNIAPVVDGYVSLGETSLQVLGVDLFAEQEMRTFTREASADDESGTAENLFRSFLVRPGAAMLSGDTAAAFGIRVGDSFTVSAAGMEHTGYLVAVLEDDSASLGNLVTTDIATAQEWLGVPGRLSRIDVRIDDGDDAFQQRLAALLPADATLLSAAGRTRSTAEMSAAFMTNLTAMSLLALLVGVFLIYNSVSFSVLQRRKLIGVLRALGVTRRQTFTIVLIESATIGVIAATLGIFTGIWLGEQLLGLVSQSINDFYFRVSVTDVSVGVFSLTKGIAAGFGAALVAAAVPALEASSYRPRMALARSVLEHQTRRLVPVVAVAGIAIIASAVAVLGLSGRNLVAGLTAVFMLILGFALVVPVLVRLLTRALAPVASRIAGVSARLAVADIGASLSRTGVAIVALAVAVSATVGVSVMVDSFRGSVSRWLDQTLQADIYAGVPRGGMQPALIRDLAAIANIDAMSTSRRAVIEDAQGRTQIMVVQMAPGSYAGTEILDADPDDVWRQFEATDTVLVSEPYGYRNGVGAGDQINLRTESGVAKFSVAATYQSYDINASALLMSRDTYDRHFNDRTVDSIGLYLAADSDVDGVIDEILRISEGRQQILVNSNHKIRELSLQIFDRTFVITDVLYWLAIGVAFIGILGAMLALQLERARDLATLRALGMTPLQLGSMITLQTGVIGLLSGIAAIPLGLVMAWVLIEVINRRAFGWQIDMAIDPGILGFAVVFAVVAALLAGVYPAWRAAQSQPALAMREE